MTTTVTAPGKLVLIGEYVVLEGAPALVAAMDRRARVVAQAQTQFSFRAPELGLHQTTGFTVAANGAVSFSETGLDADPRLRLLSAVVGAAQRHAGGALKPCHLDLDTAAFFLRPGGAKLGLGSSAAFGVALLCALLAESGRLGGLEPDGGDAPRYGLMQLSHAAHALSQGGAGSGVDIAASIWGGLLRFQRERQAGGELAPPRVSRVQPGPIAVVPVWAGEPASTPQLLRKVHLWKAQSPVQYWEVMEKLGIYAHAGVEFWTLANTPALLSVVNAYHTALQTLGQLSGADIVTGQHVAIHTHAKALGAAYKPSGAGGGDLGVALCPSGQVAQKVMSKLGSQGHEIVPMRMDAAGVQVACA